MKRISISLSCLFLIFNFTIKAQEDSTFLQNYTPPNYTFQSLEFAPNIHQSYGKSSGLDRRIFEFELDSRYRLEKFNEKNTTSIFLVFDNALNFNTTNEIKSPVSNFYSHQTRFDIEHDHFLSGQMFFGLGADIDLRINQSYQESSNPYSTRITIPLGFGFGRVYNVSGAWHAATIMEDAQAAGISVDDSDLRSFADTLVALQFRRIFDNRLRDIERHAQVLGYLEDKAGVQLDPFASALIIDSYRYERFTTRRRGFRLFAGPAFELTGDSRIESGIRNWVGFYNLFPMLRFEYYKPVNKNFQISIELESEFKTQLEGGGQNIGVSLDTGLGWFVSRRVNFYINPSVNFLRNMNSFADSTVLGMAIGSGFNYYVSPQFILSGSLLLQRNSTSGLGLDSTAFNQNFNFRCTYRLL